MRAGKLAGWWILKGQGLGSSDIHYSNPFSSIIVGEQPLITGGDGLEDSMIMDDEDISPPNQGRRNRREACTCPMCKDGEARYGTKLIFSGSPCLHQIHIDLDSVYGMWQSSVFAWSLMTYGGLGNFKQNYTSSLWIM